MDQLTIWLYLTCVAEKACSVVTWCARDCQLTNKYGYHDDGIRTNATVMPAVEPSEESCTLERRCNAHPF